ncbi:hypothetical protein T10_3478, partial [Trichinella papuae]
MLTKKEEEYSIFMSETFRQACRKLHFSKRSRRFHSIQARAKVVLTD